jgi:anti-anti-sigma factor
MRENFTLTTRKEKNYIIIETSGYLNQTGGELISEECDKYFDEGFINIILDLSGTRVVNSIGISIILEIIEKVIQLNGKLVFINLDSGIEKTFTIMGIFQYAPKAQSEEEAVKLLV